MCICYTYGLPVYLSIKIAEPLYYELTSATNFFLQGSQIDKPLLEIHYLHRDEHFDIRHYTYGVKKTVEKGVEKTGIRSI